MLRLRYSERSRADLVAAWHFIAADSPRNATAVLERLHRKIDLLRAQPLIGHPRDDLDPGLRCLNCDGYMIFYRPTNLLVRIDRIIHHSRHLPAVSFDDHP